MIIYKGFKTEYRFGYHQPPQISIYHLHYHAFVLPFRNQFYDIIKYGKIILIIEPVEKIQANFFCIKEEGGKIGRHSTNQILILEESISRFHAEIVFIDQQFYIKDVGSTTGSFIKIKDKVNLKVGMIIELGSNQFEIIKAKDGLLQLLIIEGINVSQYPYEILVKIKQRIIIKL
ncbi:hypothetical protein IMG5_091080 [Ichthyophthirius multifiliis]|uniref:FHA domain-containing protein n=1 Tax=Ichthyophthirius multifiliis TaxID=5932 RepID=G0QRA7_ICHMU|nr:hypothetical protein IMG5_091080 [Ichthyophthirius multifiliis]EGR32259.1 hypothetical protein IMG5_091080 [Ichthyophthirius multifiliis]|eukprot:XP_004035745.1 hypothetical protein IMG5_091080 [Ichthyophthirius multifiliis]